MITNERQYKITKSQLSKFDKAIQEFDIAVLLKRNISVILANAELESLRRVARDLSEQIREYEELKSGAIDVLKAESLDELPKILIQARIARGLTQAQLAKLINVKEQQIQRYESENYTSASLKRLIEISNALQLDISETAKFQPGTTPEIIALESEMDWDSFPFDEMYRRNWFDGLTGTFKTVIADAPELLQSFVNSLYKNPVQVLYKQNVRAGSGVDAISLFAWKCRIHNLASNAHPKNEFDPKSLNEQWFKKLAQDSQYEDGPIRAQKRLLKVGISLVIEPNLPQTHLDGVAFLLEDWAVIGMTLRYDRLDNFWFVLMHELIHLTKHLKKGSTEAIFDDLDASPDDFEKEADKLAGEALIPDEVWETSLAPYTQSVASIVSLAEKLSINPAIIAGRIEDESENETILIDLIGKGEVRKQFPEVVFGK